MDYHKIYDASRTPELNRLQPATYVLMDTLVPPARASFWMPLTS